MAGRHAPVARRRARLHFKWNMGWMHDTLAYFARESDPPPLPSRRAHVRDALRVQRALRESALARRGRARKKRRSSRRCRATTGRSSRTSGCCSPTSTRGRARSSSSWAPSSRRTTSGSTSGASTGISRDDAGAPGASCASSPSSARSTATHACFWRDDPDPAGFAWIDCADRDNSVVSYVRRDGGEHAVVVLNLTPVPREDYRIGAPERRHLSASRSRATTRRFGGSGFDVGSHVPTEPSAQHGFPQSFRLRLPPLGALILVPDRG